MARGTRFIALALVGGALWGGFLAQPALAQNEVAVENGRLFVEFRAATLYDAVQMVQQAVGRTDYEFADEVAAKNTLLTTQSFNNAAWDNIIRRVTNDSGFKIVPQPTGKKSIEVRAPVMSYGGEGGYPGGGGGYPGGAPGFGGQGYNGGGQGLPANPFGGGRPGQAQQYANPQTAPGLGGGTTSSEGKDYRVLRVQHVYVGGIAKLFGDADIISTEDFLLPDSALNGDGLGGGNNSNGNNNGGGFGGNNGGNNGGGGFGGNNGGGGGFGGGGFGGGGGLGGAIGGGIGF